MFAKAHPWTTVAAALLLSACGPMSLNCSGSGSRGSGKIDNVKCPVKGETVNPSAPTREYNGHVVGFSDAGGAAEWDKLTDAEKAQKWAAVDPNAGKPENANCPIMGGKVDPAQPTRQYKGHVIGFCCGSCQSVWDKLTDADKDAKWAQVAPK